MCSLRRLRDDFEMLIQRHQRLISMDCQPGARLLHCDAFVTLPASAPRPWFLSRLLTAGPTGPQINHQRSKRSTMNPYHP
ncbi:MAG: hypothetical protein MZV65_27875, partial [Chromatiales bacterium]|nr:hypothetical protein [Chromatiales bacterium]